MVSRLRLFGQNFNGLGVAASLSLHGLVMVAFLTHAPQGPERPSGNSETPGLISVTLVSTGQALAGGSKPSAGPRSKILKPSPDERADQPSSPPSAPPADSIGDQTVLALGEMAGRGAQAAGFDPAMGSNYRARLLAHIQPFRRYPAQAGALDAKVVTQLTFRVDQDGRIEGVWVKDSSGVAALDNEAMATVLRAQPMPHVPAGLPSPLTVQLPVSFSPS